jgi:hypothetical protein
MPNCIAGVKRATILTASAMGRTAVVEASDERF